MKKSAVRACRPVALLIVSFVIAAGTVHAADWPTYRNDNSRTGSTSDVLRAPLKSVWTYAAPAAPRTAWSGPDRRVIEGKELRHRVRHDDVFHVTAAAGRVYIGSSVDHKVYCRSAADGTEIWSFFTGGPVRLAPTVWNGKVLFGSDDGYVYCLDAATGAIVWKRRAGPAGDWLLARGEMISRWPVRTGITIDDGIAYFGAGIFPHEDIYLYAVNADDGKIVWKRDNISETEAGRDDLSPQGYLLTSDSMLFVPSGRSLPAAFDRKTGKKIHKRYHGWRGDGGGAIGGTRAFLADGQLYTGGAHHTLALDQKTGDVGFGWFTGRQMVVSGDVSYVANGTNIVRMNRLVYAKASRERHKMEGEIKKLRRPLYYAMIEKDSAAGDEKRLSASLDNARKKGDANEGDAKRIATLESQLAEARKKQDQAKSKYEKIKAEYEAAKARGAKFEQVGVVWTTPSRHESALIATANLVVAGGENRVAAFDAETGKKVWSYVVDGDARGLAVADGRLFVSTTTGKVYVFASAQGSAVGAPSVGATGGNPYPADALSVMYATAAEQILKRTGVKRGFCLVLGAEQGRLAYELASRSELKIYAVEPDAGKVASARKALAAAGVYGSRVSVHQADLSDIPYSNYFADLIVSDSLLLNGRLPGRAADIVRHLKPVGGVVCLGKPEGAAGASVSIAATRDWLEGMNLADAGELTVAGPWVMLERGRLPGAGDWSHLYGDSGNTASSDDHRVKGGLGVLWFGDPGPGKMVNRHAGAVGPLAAGGRLFVQGQNSIMAYDAYNGLFLWERGNKEARRTGVFKNYNPGNLVAGEDSLFVMVKDKCLELDGATGKLRATFTLPVTKGEKTYEWGYLAYRDGILYGTATIKKELARRLRRRGRMTLDATDAIFAVDTKTGKHLWTYEGKSISHHTIALGPQRVFFIDSSITSGQRADLLQQDKTELKKLKGEEAKIAEQRMKKLDVRLAVALDARTGDKIWAKPVDVTDCSEIGIGGGQLTLMYHNNVLVLCGANANGHYWRQFTSGEFKRRRLVSLSAEDGHKLWSKDANYRHRPIVVEDRIIAEPWGFDLYTGAQQMRAHPLTGQPVPWSIIRPGHHCGMLTGAPNMLMFRSGFTGFYNLDEDAGTRHFAGHRLGCWINAIPANGLVMIPESSAGCVCLFSIASTVTLEPRKARRPWTIYSSIGPKTPVKHMALNLGAPGDRKDGRGQVWLTYPRPHTFGRVTGLDLKIDIQPKFASGGAFTSINDRANPIAAAETPWLFTSQAHGLTRCTLPLLGKDDSPAKYRVKLYFAELEKDAKPGARLFDVKLQGNIIAKDFDVVAAAGGVRKAIVSEFDNIKVTDNLTVELVSKSTGDKSKPMPLLSAIEVIRTDDAAN